MVIDAQTWSQIIEITLVKKLPDNWLHLKKDRLWSNLNKINPRRKIYLCRFWLIKIIAGHYNCGNENYTYGLTVILS